MSSLRNLGERAATARLVEIYAAGYPEDCPLQPGDDAGCIRAGDTYLLLNIDGYSVKTSMLPWMSWSDLGWKSVVGAISDLIAKGASPLAAAASMGLRPERSLAAAEELVRGMVEACSKHGLAYLGGDLNSGMEEWVDVAVIGTAKNPIPRRGARPGDLVYTTGTYGLTGAAFHLYAAGNMPEGWENMRWATTRPEAPLSFLEVVEGLGPLIHAAVDVSDGLAETLYLLAEASGVTIELTQIPLHPEAEEYASASGVGAERLALYGGEEYNVVFVVDPSAAGELEGLEGVSRIGVVRRGEPLVVFRGKPVERLGWDQFSQP